MNVKSKPKLVSRYQFEYFIYINTNITSLVWSQIKHAFDSYNLEGILGDL